MPMRKPRSVPGPAAAESQAPREPIVEDEQRGPGRLEQRLRVPETLIFCDGHFPGSPMVPGTVQLGWAIRGLEALQGCPARVRSVEGLKFPSALHPGDVAALNVAVSEDGCQMRFTLEAPGDTLRVFATGRCRLERTP